MSAPSLKRCKGIARNRREHSARPKHRRKLAVVGTVHPRGTLLLLSGVMDAYLIDGRRYGLDISQATCIPAVVSRATGKIWTVGWDELIDLAVAAGIDKEGR